MRTERHGRGDRWRAQYLDPNGRERSKTFSSKIDAERFLPTVETDNLRGAYLDPSAGRVEVGELYAEWSQRQLWETNTRSAMSLAMRCTQLGTLPLVKLRRSHVESWVKGMDADGLAPCTIKTRVNSLRSVLRAAVRDRIIALDASDGVTLPRDRRREAAMVLTTASQMGAVMAGAYATFRAFVALPTFAGMRLGEAAGLQLADIDFLRRSLDVRRQVQRAGVGAVEVRAPKYGSERLITFPTVCSRCWPGTFRSTGPVTTRRAGCSRTPLDFPAPEHGGSSVAHGVQAPRARQPDAAWPSTFLCLGLGRSRVRRGDCPALPRPRESNDDLEQRPPVADRRGPHPPSRRRTVHGRDGCFCDGPTTAPDHPRDL